MNFVPLRLEPGVDLRRALEQAVAADPDAGAFVVCGIGSLVDPRLRFANATSETSLAGPFEIVSLSGTLTRDGAHLHMSVADAHGTVLGGHVVYGNEVRTTAEVLLVQMAGWEMWRQPDPATGFKELVVKRAESPRDTP